MIRLIAAAMALSAVGVQDSPTRPELNVAQVTVRQQIIIRVPRGPARVPAGSALPQWRESNGPRCIPARQIAGAMPGQNSVDLVMAGNRRVRAQFNRRCAGLDYYRGLYVDAHPDGQICAGRDAVRSRMGGQCEISAFRLLQPARR